MAQLTLKLPHLYPKQKSAIFAPERYSVIEASTKAGKAQPLDAIVYTVDGPKKMGDISVGDKVLTADGVSSVVTGVFPQGDRPIYKITFSDGAQVEADIEHLWEVQSFNGKKTIKSTRELIQYKRESLARFWVPDVEPVEFNTRRVCIDPYLVGLLIGDGGLTTETIRFSSNDAEILESVKRLMPNGHQLIHKGGCDWALSAGSNAACLRERREHLRGLLTSIGLTGKHSYNKEIPEIYRYNSIDVRKSILQGILDTDGFVDKHGQPCIEQTSEILAKHIEEVVNSLGGTVLTRIKERNGYKLNGIYQQCRPVWRQVIRFRDNSWCFRLSRKKVLLKKKKKTGRRFFRSIEFVGCRPAQCIMIDHARHLYLTNGFVPTHNTVGCMVWIVAQAWNKGKEGRNWWWVAPTLPVAKIAFRRIRRMLARTDPGKTIWKCNDSECYITLHNGACIWFKGSDVPDSLYGEDVYGVVIDEASRCKDESWYAVRSTITATQGDVRVIGNVKGRKNWAYMLGRRALAGDPGMAYFKITAYDAAEAGIFPMSEIESAKRDLPEHVFRELYLAEPADDGGNPFGIGAIARCVKPISSRDPVSFGVDLAKSNDWTWVIGLDEDGDVCVSERWQSDWGQTRSRVIQLIGNTPTLADSTGVGDPIVEDLCRECANVEGFKFSNNSKQQIMEGLASGIQRGEVGFPDGILRSELEAFEYQYTNGRVKYSAPEGQHDDGVCALALAYSRLRNPGFQLGALSSLGIVDVI